MTDLSKSTVSRYMVRKYCCIFKFATERDVNRQQLSRSIKTGVDFEKVRRRTTIVQLKESVPENLERETN